MKLAADFRTQARQALRGKWLMAVLWPDCWLRCWAARR